MNACCCWKHSAYSVFSRGSTKGDNFIPMSISIMSPQMLPRKVFIFTVTTGTVYSLIKDKPNTYWSKRSGHPELSNFFLDESKNYTKEAERTLWIIKHMNKEEIFYLIKSFPFFFWDWKLSKDSLNMSYVR